MSHSDGPEARFLDAEERADLEFRQNVFLTDELRETLIEVIRCQAIDPWTEEDERRVAEAYRAMGMRP